MTLFEKAEVIWCQLSDEVDFTVGEEAKLSFEAEKKKQNIVRT